MYTIDFHADDYAASIDNSKRILELLRGGHIDSISILANMGCFKECMEMLRQNWDSFPKKPLLSVHLNLIDGFWLSSRKGERIINNSWEKIFLHSVIPGSKRKKLRSAYASEIAAQIEAVQTETKGLKASNGSAVDLRIDSHVHTHMIPLVFEALMDALNSANLLKEVRFIRCSSEPLAMFLFTPGISGTIRPINLLKNITLHFLSHSIRVRLSDMGIQTSRLFGVAMTGHMDSKRVGLLMEKMKKYAKKKDAHLEILSHPGRVSESEVRPEYGPDDVKAFTAEGRDVEYNMLLEQATPANH